MLFFKGIVYVWSAPMSGSVSSIIFHSSMGGESSKRDGVLFRSFQSEARSFCCFFHRFAQIYVLITISLWDIGFTWCFMTFFFCFERVLLAMRGCTFSLRGCSRTLKTPNSPPLGARVMFNSFLSVQCHIGLMLNSAKV